MKTSKKDYKKMSQKKAEKSPLLKNMFFAFISGGAICDVGQVVNNILLASNLSKEAASYATPVIMIFLGAFFTGLGVYDKLAKYAGAGTIVPITGFANAIVAPAMEFKSEGHILGMGSKMFVIAGPVLVFGIAAAVLYGFILYIFKLT